MRRRNRSPTHSSVTSRLSAKQRRSLISNPEQVEDNPELLKAKKSLLKLLSMKRGDIEEKVMACLETDMSRLRPTLPLLDKSRSCSRSKSRFRELDELGPVEGRSKILLEPVKEGDGERLTASPRLKI